MEAISERPTATIYQFPVGGRRAVAVAREPVKAPVIVAAGGSWYHDEAIQEAERARKQ